MADVVFMFWLLWLLLIIVRFFMTDSTLRITYMIWLLLVISTAAVFIQFADFMVSVAWLIIASGVLFSFCWTYLWMKQLFYIFILMIGYTGLLYWQGLAPIWFFLPLDMLIPVLLSVLVILLEHNKQRAYMILVGGITFGQAFYQVILWLYGLDNVIGGETYMLSLSYSLFLTCLFHAGWRGFTALSNFVHRKLI